MKLYLLNLSIYMNNDVEKDSNVYSTLEKAKEEGMKYIKENFKDFLVPQNAKVEELKLEELFRINNFDYDFEIVEIPDLEYAEKFELNEKGKFEDYEYYKLEPTHIRYNFDYNGNLIERYLEYRCKNDLWRSETSIRQFPEDLEEKAGEKFKIGDIVRVKNLSQYNYSKEYPSDKLFVVRWLPRRREDQKYFENTYALISIDLGEFAPGLYTFEYHEKDIEKYEGKVDRNSPIGVLQRIIKEDLQITREVWNDLKNGTVYLDEKENYKQYLTKKLGGEIEFENDNWGFFSTTISKRRTGLPTSIHPCKNIFGVNIKENTPKIRVDNYDIKSTFFLTIEENPKVIIGECKLSKKDLEKVCFFIKNNLDILLKHFDCNNEEVWDDELWEKIRVDKP